MMLCTTILALAMSTNLDSHLKALEAKLGEVSEYTYDASDAGQVSGSSVHKAFPFGGLTPPIQFGGCTNGFASHYDDNSNNKADDGTLCHLWRLDIDVMAPLSCDNCYERFSGETTKKYLNIRAIQWKKIEPWTKIEHPDDNKIHLQEKCSMECQNTPNCNGFTVYAKGDFNGNNCKLMNIKKNNAKSWAITNRDKEMQTFLMYGAKATFYGVDKCGNKKSGEVTSCLIDLLL
jgi:hypothetical protein